MESGLTPTLFPNIIVYVMPRTSSLPHPFASRMLGDLGENIRLARLRRDFSATLVAERAGMSRSTLRAIENGSPSASLGSIAKVLHVLGLHEDLKSVARDDVLGQRLQDAGLSTPTRKRAAKRHKRQPVDPVSNP